MADRNVAYEVAVARFNAKLAIVSKYAAKSKKTKAIKTWNGKHPWSENSPGKEKRAVAVVTLEMILGEKPEEGIFLTPPHLES